MLKKILLTLLASLLFLTSCDYIQLEYSQNQQMGLFDRQNQDEMELLESSTYYEIFCDKSQYYYSIYNLEHEAVIDKQSSPQKPHITEISPDIIKIIVQSGTGIATQWGYFYDVRNDCFSETFYSILDHTENMVLFRKDTQILIQSIFCPNEYSYIIPIIYDSFSPVADPIVSANIIGNGSVVEITYYVGSQYEKKTETFHLPDISKHYTR